MLVMDAAKSQLPFDLTSHPHDDMNMQSSCIKNHEINKVCYIIIDLINLKKGSLNGIILDC